MSLIYLFRISAMIPAAASNPMQSPMNERSNGCVSGAFVAAGVWVEIVFVMLAVEFVGISVAFIVGSGSSSNGNERPAVLYAITKGDVLFVLTEKVIIPSSSFRSLTAS